MADKQLRTDGGVADASVTDSRDVTSSIKRIIIGVSKFVLVSLPSLFILLWTINAALVPAADVFFIALTQVIFLMLFFLYRRWRSSR